MYGGFASLGMKLGDKALLLGESQRIVGVVGTCQVHPQPITPTAVMPMNKGDHINAERSDVVVAIFCVIRL